MASLLLCISLRLRMQLSSPHIFFTPPSTLSLIGTHSPPSQAIEAKEHQMLSPYENYHPIGPQPAIKRLRYHQSLFLSSYPIRSCISITAHEYPIKEHCSENSCCSQLTCFEIKFTIIISAFLRRRGFKVMSHARDLCTLLKH
ncbi:hypothetical protein BDZ45DRAFT_346903 [Acephala macrosclerotiorum]|nr:hypothetical protein BDZ45DRAFT_346903 [Acephala macrosclerotiorum]